jgi:hypothetical protein
MLTQAEVAEKVEALLIDGTTLDAVLGALVEVCYAKRDHLLTNWQDKSDAKQWGRAAALLDRTRNLIDV